MTNIIHKSISLLSLLAITIAAFAAPEAEFGQLSKAWILHADGSQEFRCDQELTLFTHTAMNSTYGETFIVYNPDFQELKIHSSYTRQKDGTIIKSPENAFVEVLPRFAIDAPAYNQLKEMVVVHTGLELGATIYLDYSILTKPGYYPELDVNVLLQETSPVKEYKVSITVPKDKTLAKQLYASQVKAVERNHDSTKEICWTLRNLPASSREAFQPENKDKTPRLVVSTHTTGTEALAFMNKTFKDAIAYESETFAQHITEKATNEEDKIKIIHEHVVKNLGYSLVPMAETGYTIRGIDNVLRSAYGTLAEKTQLLNVLLNAAGIQSEIVAVYPGNIDAKASGLAAIKNLVVKATVAGKNRYLSAVSLMPSVITNRGELDQIVSLAGSPIQVQTLPVIVKESKTVTVSSDQAKDGFVVCSLPSITSGLDNWGMTTLNSERTGIFEIPSLLQEEIIYTVTPSEDLKLTTPATEQITSNSFGKVTRTISSKGGVYEVIRTIELNKTQFSSSEYNQVRTLINEWVNPNNRVLLFSTVR